MSKKNQTSRLGVYVGVLLVFTLIVGLSIFAYNSFSDDSDDGSEWEAVVTAENENEVSEEKREGESLKYYGDLGESGNTVDAYIFYGDGCPHCTDEKAFLKKFEGYENIKINYYETWYSSANNAKMDLVSDLLKANARGVPFTVIGDEYWVGYGEDSSTGAELESRINYCIENICPNETGSILGG